MPHSVKSFVTAFLAVAILLSSTFVAGSLYINSRPVPKAVQTAPHVTNAFVDSYPGGATDPEVLALQLRDENNMTGQIANVLAQELLKANPNGPIDQNGESVIEVPGNLNVLIDEYLQGHPKSEGQLVPKISDKDLALTDATDAQAITRYLAQVEEIVSKLPPELEAVDASTAEFMVNQNIEMFHKTSGQFKSVKVPRSIADFHKSLLFSFQISANFTQLLASDPLGAAALGDTYQREVTKALDDLTAEAERLQSAGLIPAQERPLVQKLLGIETAYAFSDVPAFAQRVIQIAYQIKKFYDDYLKKYMDILLEYAKNTVLKAMAAQVVNWVAGGPEPQFVTNWDGFLRQAADNGIGRVLNEALPAVCGGPDDIGNLLTNGALGQMAQLIRDIMQPVNTLNGNLPYEQCTLSKVVQNFKDFERDLRNGGWVAYAELMKPQNTLNGNLIAIADRKLTIAGKQREEAEKQAAAGSGFTGQQLCDDGKKPLDKGGADAYNAQFIGPVQPGKQKNPGDCADGSSPHVATPGIFSKDLTSKGFDHAYDRLVNARDWKAMLAYVADMALSNFMKKSAKGLLSYAQSTKSSGGGGGNGGPVTSQAPNPEPTATSTLEEAGQILARKESSLEDARRYVQSLTDTVNALNNILGACKSEANVVADAKVQLPPLMSLRDTISLKVEDLKAAVDGLRLFTATPGSAATLHTQFGTLAQAQTEADNLSIQRQKADGVTLQTQNLFVACSQNSLSFPTDGGNPAETKVVITTPADGAAVTGTVNVNAQAVDGTIKLEIYIDGALAASQENATTLTHPWDASGSGSHTIYAKAYDAAATAATSATVTVTSGP